MYNILKCPNPNKMNTKLYDSNSTSTESYSSNESTIVTLWYVKSGNMLTIRVLRNDPKKNLCITTDSSYRPFNAEEIPKDFLEELKDSVESFNLYCKSIDCDFRLELTDPELLRLVIKYLNPSDDIVENVKRLIV